MTAKSKNKILQNWLSHGGQTLPWTHGPQNHLVFLFRFLLFLFHVLIYLQITTGCSVSETSGGLIRLLSIYPYVQVNVSWRVCSACAQCVCWKMNRGWLASSGTLGFRDTQADSVNEHTCTYTHTLTNHCEVAD